MSLFANMNQLNFPNFKFRLKRVGDKEQIFDVVRKKFVALTPEEWVRQHVIHFLNLKKEYPLSLMAVETLVVVNRLKQRADIVIYSRKGVPQIIIECKAPSVQINQTVFNQAARYNMTLKVDYLFFTNGLNHYIAKLNYINQTYSFLKDIPLYNSL